MGRWVNDVCNGFYNCLENWEGREVRIFLGFRFEQLEEWICYRMREEEEELCQRGYVYVVVLKVVRNVVWNYNEDVDLDMIGDGWFMGVNEMSEI